MTTETPAVENNNPTISLVNLQNILKIVDVAAERGAFKGSELTAVGRERDIIAAFLAAVQPPVAEDEATQKAAPGDQTKASEPKAPAKKGRAKKA